ncbi:MAG: hypothetical protein IJ567_01130 [Lachnospiraceae bacterium]|nr:hypothetical protein [Lachnospiraceae bacterium]
MPINEKEYNGNLLDQISILERIERVAKQADCQAVLDEINFEKKQIERKLYQTPPIIDHNDNN